MKTDDKKTRAAEVPSVEGDSFDSYVADVERQLDANESRALDVLRAHYSLASQLIALRRHAHLTQIQVAERAQVNQSDVSRLERGSANVSQAALERIGQVFGARLGFVGPDGRAGPTPVEGGGPEHDERSRSVGGVGDILGQLGRGGQS